MSLIDALLNEEVPLTSPPSREFIRRAGAAGKPLARSPEMFTRKAAFVALRTDGALGSGSADDPFNGSTVRGPVVPLPGMTLPPTFVPSNVAMATVTFPSGAVVAYVTVSTGSVAHGIVSGDLVTVVGITLPSGSNVKWLDKYNGDKTVETLSETSFRYGFGVLPTDLPPVPITGAVQCRAWYAIAETQRPHKFVAGDIVEIAGFTGSYAGYYNCVNLVRTAAGNTFTYRLDHTLFRSDLNKPGNPEGDAATCRKVVYHFDEVMRALPPRSVIFLGEGTFETRGNRGGAELPDVPRHSDGQRIIGSGINVTTLMVIIAEPPLSHLNYYAIGQFTYYNAVDTFEVADLTIDCNLRRHQFNKPYGVLAKGAVAVAGWHTRLKRVRTFDFGTLSSEAESFPMGLGLTHDAAGESFNCVMEDCIAEYPHSNNVRETTCMGILGAGTQDRNRGCAIRNSVLDGRYFGRRSGQYHQVEAFTQAGTGEAGYTFDIKTRLPHKRFLDSGIPELDSPNNIRLQGITVKKEGKWVASVGFDGVYPIDSINENARTIRFTIPNDPYGPNGITSAEWDRVSAGLAGVGTQFHGAGADAGRAAVVEGNRVYHMHLGVNHDTGATFDVSYVRNYYSEVYAAIIANLGNPDYVVRQKICERNVIELTHGYNIPGAGAVAVHSAGPIRRIAIRDNIIRCAKDIPDQFAYAMTSYGPDRIVMERNCIDHVTQAAEASNFFAIQDETVGRVRTNDNIRLNGQRERAVDRTLWKENLNQPNLRNRHELPEDLDDALFMAFF